MSRRAFGSGSRLPPDEVLPHPPPRGLLDNFAVVAGFHQARIGMRPTQQGDQRLYVLALVDAHAAVVADVHEPVAGVAAQTDGAGVLDLLNKVVVHSVHRRSSVDAAVPLRAEPLRLSSE